MAPQVAESSVDDVVELICLAQGGPGNTITWSFLGVEIGNTSNISVVVESVMSGGDYTCTVRNDAGNSTAVSTILGDYTT